MARKDIKSVLVVGGTGFIGSAVVAELSKHPIARLSVIHTSPLSHTKRGNAHYYRLDLESDALDEVMRGHDAVLLLAPPDTEAMKNIASAIRKTRPLHILYASTVLLYDARGMPAKEETRVRFHNAYERAKLAEEKIVRSLAKGNVMLTIARLGNVYGDVLNKGIVGRAFHALYGNGAIGVAGNAVRDYVFIDDVAHALAHLVLEPKGAVEIINISTGEGTPLQKLLTNIETIAGQKIPRHEVAESAENAWVIADNAKLKKRALEPKYDLRRGLREAYKRFLAWYD